MLEAEFCWLQKNYGISVSGTCLPGRAPSVCPPFHGAKSYVAVHSMNGYIGSCEKLGVTL